MDRKMSQSLSDSDFSRLSSFIETEYGIKMPAVKKTMLESRLQKRLRLLQIPTYQKYCDYLFSPEGKKKEISQFVNKVTTNKTDFFREPNHFTYLTKSILPQLLEKEQGQIRQIKLWSAGCSSGEEAYTLAMVLEEYADKHSRQPFTYSIIATDISEDMLRIGRNAIYPTSCYASIPQGLRQKYFLKSRDKSKPYVKIVPEIRKRVTFQTLNLMDRNFGLKQEMHIIFCRNVIIYFNKQTQGIILEKITRFLNSGGYLFQGHSESIQGLPLPLKAVHPTIFKKIL